MIVNDISPFAERPAECCQVVLAGSAVDQLAPNATEVRLGRAVTAHVDAGVHAGQAALGSRSSTRATT